jgi:preprotein translocase subunit SecA
MFEVLTASIQEDFVKYIYRVELVRQDEQPQAPRVQRLSENRDEVASGAGGAGTETAATGAAAQPGNPQQAVSDKTPRNAPCPCGSGLKYKKCHGAAA